MLTVLGAAAISLTLSLLGTPLFIRFLIRKQYGQFIRQDGPTSHYTKRGTPTMGGVVIVLSAIIGYFGAGLLTGRAPAVSAILVLFLFFGMGLVGFLDDFVKIRKHRSLGLSPGAKIVGQGLVGTIFAVLALQFRSAEGFTPATTAISFVRDTALDPLVLGIVVATLVFVVWANLLITAWSNAVNLTDGLDGLATGASMFVFGAYTIISMWQNNHRCASAQQMDTLCYTVRDPIALAVVAAAITGACFGFLWWNGSPASIFMGDTGSLALGAALAGISILTRTELLAVIIGGLFVIIVGSSLLQVVYFKATGGKRIFKMAPLHHHFELKGWGEVIIVIRFWIIAALFVCAGCAIFYGEWLAS